MAKHHHKKKKINSSTTIIEGAAHEMKVNPPRILARTREKFGAKRAEAQRVAILLSKARKRGARIKKKVGKK